MSTSRYNHHSILPSLITRSVTGFAVALGLVAAAVPAWSAEKAAACNKGAITGRWKTDSGNMVLRKGTGNRYSATFTFASGRLVGKLTGRVLKGRWSQTSAAGECGRRWDGRKYWGRYTFKFDKAGCKFKGKWSYCNKPVGRIWNGWR